MNRIEYLKKEVTKYGLLSSLYAIGLLAQIVIVIFLIIHMAVYWFLHDYLTTLQVLKYSFSHFWFLYAYFIIFTLCNGAFESYSVMYRDFRKQLEEEERKESKKE